MDDYVFLGPFEQILTFESMPLRGALSDDRLAVTNRGGILIRHGKVSKVGSYNVLRKLSRQLKAREVVMEGAKICLPGFIDAHTHLCFAGSRARDYAMRNAGMTYLEIGEKGGGIWDTVQKTRAAEIGLLVGGMVRRSSIASEHGVTTMEVKSGYGLSVDEEIRMLRCIKEVKSLVHQDLVPTCLAAHVPPKDYDGTPSDYLEEISEKLFPTMKRDGLGSRVDAFIEEGAFNQESVGQYFAKAQLHGFELTVHADQFHVGGSEVAVKFGAMSADHLEASTEKEISMLSKSNVMPVALPGASMGLGVPFTPARKLLDAGCSLTIASDWNPGSAPMGNLMLQASVLGTYEQLTNAEVLSALTYRAAAALGLSDRGRLVEDMKADFIIYDVDDYREITYQQGMLLPMEVWKNGEKVLF